ncbi:putative Jag-like protein [Nostocoides japonicum T1-X7]|uniref:Putative Jag-like protein n=1 Tax=Nostocoides japonicum T1-X7 TaxID=1194083 RepID=A0A077M7X4_9MICO|nr:R3H domain-containing nucleic acid-binding protein [Tetrasphaera japonica]CCH80164.1 putative Jag-like protein [Tetrasphaera japonica T1-X7]
MSETTHEQTTEDAVATEPAAEVVSAADLADPSTPDPSGSPVAAVPDLEPGDESDGAPARAARGRRLPSREQLEKEGEVAADFLETLLDICDLDGDLDVDIDGDRAAVSIVDSEDGRVPRRLIGPNGKVLDALQELTRLAVYSSTGERSRLILDIAGHRSDRRSALVEIARTAIAAVKETGASQALEPMTPFERKIVHDEVLASGLRSESDGTEPQRYVVVHPL